MAHPHNIFQSKRMSPGLRHYLGTVALTPIAYSISNRNYVEPFAPIIMVLMPCVPNLNEKKKKNSPISKQILEEHFMLCVTD